MSPVPLLSIWPPGLTLNVPVPIRAPPDQTNVPVVRNSPAPPIEPEKEINAAAKVIEWTELPNEPAPAAAAEGAPTEEETKPASPASRAMSGPMAEVSTDDNQSFPL